MKFNLRAAMAGAAGGVQQTAQIALNEEAQRLRDERMMQYRQQETQMQGQQKMQQMQAQQVADQAALQEQRTYDEGQAAIAREQQLADAKVDREHDMSQIETRAKLDPRANKTEINNNMGGGIGHLRGKKAQEGMGTNDAARIDEIQRAGAGVAKIRDSLGILESVGSEFKTGKVPDLLAAVGEYMGTDAGAARQMVNGAVAPMVLELMSQQKGPQTDADRRQFEKLMATYDKSPEAFQAMLGLANKYVRRATENAQALDEYMQTPFYQENGHLGQFKMPNAIDTRETEHTQKSVDAVDDPLGLFN